MEGEMKKKVLFCLAALCGLASVGAAQNLFAVMRGHNMAHRFDHVTGQFMGSFGAHFWTDSFGAAIGPDGYLYVCIGAPVQQILRFDPYTGHYAGALGAGFGRPIDIEFGPDGLMYVATWVGTTAQINRFEPSTGQYRGSFGAGFMSHSIWNGSWLAFDGDTLLVTDDAVDGVLKFDSSTGQYEGMFAGGFVQNPLGITAYEPGRVAVLDRSPGQVLRFDVATGQYRGAFAHGFLGNPTAIETLTDGKVGVVSELHGAAFLGHAVLRFEPETGKYVGHFGLGFLSQVVGGLVAARPAQVSGVIEYVGWDFGTENDLEVTFELRAPGGTTPVETVVARPNADGTFTFGCISRGVFDVTAKSSRHLRDKNTNVTIDRVGGSGLSFTLLAGDVDDDNFIGLSDFLILAATYEVSPPTDPDADLNGDGNVDLGDFLILAANYETAGAP
jgi:hypothetical protein